MSDNNIFAQGVAFEMWSGVVEDINDPEMLGRVRVRIFGYHIENKVSLPTSDLPWAMPIQPITSAATSGIGTTPLGLLPGSWVVGYFLDNRDQQIPVVLGTLGAFQTANQVPNNVMPPDMVPLIPAGTQTQGDQSVEGVSVDTGGNPVRQENIKSPPGWRLGQTSAQYESGGKGPGTINNYANSNDPGGASYGSYQFASYLPPIMANGKARPSPKGSALSSFIAGSRFSAAFAGLTPATPAFDAAWKQVAAQNTAQFEQDQTDYIQKNFYLVMLSRLKMVGLDLSGFSAGVQDLIWSTAVQLGPNKTKVFTDALGSQTQLSDTQIVTLVSDYKILNVPNLFKSSSANIQASVKNRYISEKAACLALCNGGVVASTAAEAATVYGGAPYKPSNDKNNQYIVATGNYGFRDPSGRYPLQSYSGEQDTNKLARGVLLGSAAELKSNNRVYGMPLPGGNSFDQPPNPYAAKYPYNKVTETVSGHVMEFDDTPGRERINLYHKTGTFTEIDAIGNRVSRIVGTDYTIIDNNGYISIQGQANVSVSGSCNVYIGGDAHIEVDGDVDLQCGNDINLEAEGDINMSAGGQISMHSTQIYLEAEDSIYGLSANNINLEGTVVNILGDGSVAIEASEGMDIKAGNDIHVTAGALASVQGQTVALDGAAGTSIDSGYTVKAIAAEVSKVSLAGYPTDGLTYVDELLIEDEYPPLRDDDQTYLSESPDDHTTPAQALAQMQASGTIGQSDINYTPSQITDNSGVPVTGQTEGTTAVPDTSYINTLTSVPGNFRLSPNFTVHDLTTGVKVTPTPLQAQFGLSEGQIAGNLQLLATYVLEPIKKRYPGMFVTSCFRTYSQGSSHTLGQAADIQVTGFTNADMLAMAKDLSSIIPFDQLLLEHKSYGTGKSWIHVSYSSNKNRSQILTLFNNKTYSQGLTMVV